MRISRIALNIVTSLSILVGVSGTADAQTVLQGTITHVRDGDTIEVENAESVQLTIIDIKGQVVFEHDHGKLALGENKVQLDLSGLSDGIYICQLKNYGTNLATQKLVIAH